MLQKGLQETIMILAGSVGDGRVFFAREATSEQNPATMHGAFLSWMMKAASMLRVASRRPLAVIDKANNGLEEIDDLIELYDTSNLTFGSLSVFFNPRSNEIESVIVKGQIPRGRIRFLFSMSSWFGFKEAGGS